MVVLKGVSAHEGANEKYKAHISKYVRHILKYLRRIFCLLKTGENNADKNDGHCGVLMSEKTVQKMPLMNKNHKRHFLLPDGELWLF